MVITPPLKTTADASKLGRMVDGVFGFEFQYLEMCMYKPHSLHEKCFEVPEFFVEFS